MTKYLKLTEDQLPLNITPKIILVPHAGLEYSGFCAATAYNCVKKHKYKGIILLCTYHDISSYDNGLIVYDKNTNMPENINVTENKELFSKEHSYGNNMIFINEIFKGVPVTAFLAGHKTNYQTFAKYLSDLIDKKYLLVVTTDLSHVGQRFNSKIYKIFFLFFIYTIISNSSSSPITCISR